VGVVIGPWQQSQVTCPLCHANLKKHLWCQCRRWYPITASHGVLYDDSKNIDEDDRKKKQQVSVQVFWSGNKCSRNANATGRHELQFCSFVYTY